jgi:hypothetical protein
MGAIRVSPGRRNRPPVKVRSLAELQTPEVAVRRFTSLGFSTGGMLPAEDAAEYQQRTIASAELIDAVPEGVRRAFDRLRTLHSYGVLCYDAFTAVIDLAPRVADLAVRQRFVLFHGNIARALDKQGQPFHLNFTSVEELVKELNKRKGRLAGWPTGERFTGGFWQLLRWARREGLLSGQRARHAERRIAEWRNRIAHPDSHYLLSPVDAAREIHGLPEFINRLWDWRTPGGRLYPAPACRDVLALAYNDHGEMSVGLAESMTSYPSLDAFNIIVVRGDPEDPGLFDYDAAYENTRMPTELLWGPGDYAGANAWLEEAQPQSDTIDHLDRCFLLRRTGSSVDSPRNVDVFAALAPAEQDGVWFAVRADAPIDAFLHVKSGHEPPLGPCASCATEGLVSGGWHEVMAAIVRWGVPVTPSLPRARMPGRWRSQSS